MISQNSEHQKPHIVKHSLSKHFSLALTAVVTAILISFSTIAVFYNITSIENELESYAAHISKLAEIGMSTAVWDYNHYAAKDLIDALFLKETVVFARVMTDTQSVLAEKKRHDLREKDFAFFEQSSGYITKTASIERYNEKIGVFQVAISRENIQRELFLNIAGIIALMLVVITAISITSIVITRRYIFRPLLKLTESAKMIAKGNLDVSVTSDRRDEIGSLADDFNTMRESVKQANEKLEEYARTLEKKVEERTNNLEKTLQELKQSQSKLIQSEKMAALGQLIAGVAHEINTPLGAIRSSIGNISSSLQQTLEQLPILFQTLSKEEQENFLALVSRSQENITSLSSREERKLRKNMARKLKEYEIENADNVADTLTDIGVYDDIYHFLPFFRHPRSALILQAAYNLSGLQRNSRNIATATDRASKVVFALKSYARFDYSEEMIESGITEGIETVLTLYHNQLKHGTEVVRNYGKLPPVTCYPDELNQVWTNLIHNAIHAMENKGTMKIDANQEKEHVVITIADSGKGIPEDIKERIFDPFFTTKAKGEGSGLGLDIVRKIVEKHKGKIKVESEPGKTVFSIILPVNPNAEHNKN